MVAMECLTVIENIESEIPQNELDEAEELLANTIGENPESAPMLEEILAWVQGEE